MKFLQAIKKITTILLVTSFIFFSISFAESVATQKLYFPNIFLASKSLVDRKEEMTLEESMNADYLKNAQANSAFNEFSEETIDPSGFYLRIDKINLFKAVVKDVDPRYKDVYVKSWEKGVSHGKFTAYPDQIGITYLFSHAVSNSSRAEEENAWFTYMDQLTYGDEVVIYYENVKYVYEVSEIHEVAPDATGLYTGVAPVQKIRMQYCGPPTGSLSMRTLVDALLVDTVSIGDFG